MGAVFRMYDPDRIDQRDPELLDTFCRLVGRVHIPYHRPTVTGLENYPEGAALVVGNHNAGLWSPDTFILCRALYLRYGPDAVPYGLGHEIAVRTPPLNQLLVPLGAVRATHDNARKLFDAGRKVLVYPGGDLESMRPYRHRNRLIFGGRRGYVRLALRMRVPIAPVVAAGAHSTFIVLDDLQWLAKLIRADRLLRIKVWPLTLCAPWGLSLGPVPYFPFPSRILIDVMPPVHFDRLGDEAAEDEAYVAECADRVERSMQDTLTRLSARL